MNTEQIEIANLAEPQLPPGKFSMDYDPDTGVWRASMTGFVPIDSIIVAMERMKFRLIAQQSMNDAAAEQQKQALNIEMAGTIPVPPQFRKQRR